MLPGYNHNVQYKERIFHIQTEDSGVNNPHIITLLYEGGNILARKKTSYEDILKSEKLPSVVKEMMQEQHKSMLRDLKNGGFDNIIFREKVPEAPVQPPVAAPQPQQQPQAATPVTAPPQPVAPQPQQQPLEPLPPPPPPPREGAKIIELKEGEELKDEDIFGSDLISDKSLDEVILNYLAQNLDEE